MTVARHSMVEVRAQSKGCGIAICFVWDESGSVGDTNFQNSKNFMRDLVEALSDVSSKQCRLLNHSPP